MDGDIMLKLLNTPANPTSIAFFFGARHQSFGLAGLFIPTSKPWQVMVEDVVFFTQIIDCEGSSPTVSYIDKISMQ